MLVAIHDCNQHQALAQLADSRRDLALIVEGEALLRPPGREMQVRAHRLGNGYVWAITDLDRKAPRADVETSVMVVIGVSPDRKIFGRRAGHRESRQTYTAP